MQLSVFTQLANVGKIKQVIIKNDPTDAKQRAIVELETTYGDTLPITTRSKQPRRFKDPIEALEVLNGIAGELTNEIKVKFK